MANSTQKSDELRVSTLLLILHEVKIFLNYKDVCCSPQKMKFLAKNFKLRSWTREMVHPLRTGLTTKTSSWQLKGSNEDYK